MYNYKLSERVENILYKLSKKDVKLYNRILKKIEEILGSESINHYKNLRHDLKEFKRVQIGHFVLIFKFEDKQNLILFDDFDHHDKIYMKGF